MKPLASSSASTSQSSSQACSYCEGQGYFHLLLGGTETCEKCSGTGKEKEDE